MTMLSNAARAGAPICLLVLAACLEPVDDRNLSDRFLRQQWVEQGESCDGQTGLLVFAPVSGRLTAMAMRDGSPSFANIERGPANADGMQTASLEFPADPEWGVAEIDLKLARGEGGTLIVSSGELGAVELSGVRIPRRGITLTPCPLGF